LLWRWTPARVREVVARLIEERSAPAFVRSDNGSEFIARLLTVFLSELGSASHFVAPGSLWQNGFVESFHSTLRREHLGVEVFANVADAQIKAAIWRRWHNEVRPHSSLGNLPPRVAAQVWNSGRVKPSLHSKLQIEPISSTPEISS